MNTTTYVFGIAVACVVLASVVELLRRRRLRERHALWWIVAGVIALIIAIFPAVLRAAAAGLGITIPTNLGFFVCIVLLFMVSVSQSAELTVLEEKTRLLAERLALLEERVERAERALVRGVEDVNRKPGSEPIKSQAPSLPNDRGSHK